MKKIFTWIIVSSILFTVTYGEEDVGKNSIEDQILEVGYTINMFQDVDISDVQALTKVFSEMLLHKEGLNYVSKSSIVDDISLFKDAQANIKFDVLILPPLDYIEISDYITLEPFLVTAANGEIFDEYLLLTHQDMGIKQLMDLKNKKLIIGSSGNADVPYLWLESILIKENLPQSKVFFFNIVESNKASQTVLPVFFKQAEGCIISREAFNIMVELNPQLGRDLSIISISPKFLKVVICINKDMDNESNRDLIEESLVELHLDPIGKKLLALFRADQLVPFMPTYLETVRDLYYNHQKYESSN